MPVRRALLAALLSALATGAAAQAVVTSLRPDRVAVTIYRDPNRNADDAPRLDWLNGFALVTETRQVSLPAGESTIRFEGVAGGIVPQSAIVTGFPDGVVERNRDAYLLSPATLLDRSLGRRVHIRRTSRATGAVREEEAVILSGTGGAVVLQTRAGYESLRCTGLPEALVYDRVPPELAPTPTLSVRTRASRPATATVTLSYIAAGFDWQADYVISLAPDGHHADIFAWMTLASTDETSFVQADTQAVAGRVNYQAVPPQPREGGPLNLQCWPWSRTSDIPLELFEREVMAKGDTGVYGEGSDIVVTGTRLQSRGMVSASPIAAVMTAELETLGDLKLYRIPEPVTVAARSQKQVALLNRPDVPIDLVYRQRLNPAGVDGEPRPVPLFLVTRNREAEGLGLPLPAGSVALFAQGSDRLILLGESALEDRAIGEDVEIQFDGAEGVRSHIRLVRETRGWRDYALEVTSDRDSPIRFEAEFPGTGEAFRPADRLGRRDGAPLWAATVPAHGRVVLRYRIRLSREERARPRRR